MRHVRAHRKKPETPRTARRRDGRTAAQAPVPQAPAPAARPSAFYAAGPAVGLGAPVQAKVRIGRPGDVYEREADSVAERVVRSEPVPAVSRLPAGGLRDTAQRMEAEPEEVRKAAGEMTEDVQEKCAACEAEEVQRKCEACEAEEVQGKCEACEAEEVQEKCAACEAEEVQEQAKSEEMDLQEKPAAVRRAKAAAAGHAIHSSGSGETLRPRTLERLEAGFGVDLGGVRVHHDALAGDTARQLGARAFTHKNHIWLGAGESQADLRLMAHEATHVLQQGGVPRHSPLSRADGRPPARRGAARDGAAAASPAAGQHVQRLTDEPMVMGGWLDDRLSEAGEALGAAADVVTDTAEAVGEAVVDTATAVGEAVVDTATAVGEAAAEGLSWLATTAGRAALAAANALAEQLGGSVTVTSAGLVITIPSVSFCPTLTHTFELPGMSQYVPLIGGGFTVGAVTVIGSAGLNFSFRPSLTAVLGPCVLSGVRVELNPITGRYFAQGTVSVGAALSQLNVARAGLRGQVDVIVVVPIGGVPVPIKIPAAALEGGAQLALRLSGGGTLANSVTLLYAGGSLTLNATPSLALGGAIDLDLAAFGRIEILGNNLCDLVWPLWHWDASIGHQWSLPLTLSYGRGGPGLSMGSIVSTPVPFEQAVRGIDRTPPGTDCPLVDRICVVLRALGLLPSQRGVGWKGHPKPRVPTPCNTHPDAPYIENPLIPSGAKCRGVCGPDCASNCVALDDMRRCAEDATGSSHFICVYKGVQDCGTHEGCRHHDACYDWCAAGGHASIFDSCHRWCDFGCICEHDLNQCIGWALGLPPFDGRMVFYDDTISPMLGPFPGPCPASGVMSDRVDRYLALGDPTAIVTALAEAPLQERLELSADPIAMELLEAAIGPALWPVARRILEGAASTTVPSLDEATWFLADQAIQNGDHARALDVVLAALMARGLVDGSLAGWSHVARGDRGEGLTIFNLIEDPVTHERRARAPVRVEIYTPAFTDVGWLFSTVMHEYLHVLQVLAGYEAAEFDAAGNQGPEFIARDEVEAYLWEIEHAVGSGLINDVAQMRDVGGRLTREFNRMTPALQAQYQTRYDAAQQRVRDVVAGRPRMSIDEARRIVQESSREIAELLRRRPGNEAAIDAQIEAVRRRRSQAMIEVALADNPAIQVVRPGEPGTYRVPTVDADGRVRYLHGGIQVAWHLAPTSTSAYTLGEGLGAGGQMAVAGTAVQGRVHPFPPDIDFDEHIHVVADTLREAGRLAAGRIIAGIRRISGGPVPGRDDIEFRHLITFPVNGPRLRMSLGDVQRGGAVNRLGRSIAQLNGGNINTFWRGMIADADAPTGTRFTDVTRVVFVTAERRDGSELIGMGGSADFNLAFLEDPGETPSTALGQFAWEMCADAVRRAQKGKWLKAAKRAYNYFSTIGDTAHMAALEPVFRRPETRVEQYATVLDGIQHALATRDMGVRQPRTRILTVDEARAQVEQAATVVETLPDSGAGSDPAAIARDLRILAGHLRARNARGHLQQDDNLARDFARDTRAVRAHIDAGVRGQVLPIIEGVVRPACPS